MLFDFEEKKKTFFGIKKNRIFLVQKIVFFQRG